MAYITKDDLKQYIGAEKAKDDALLEALIPNAQAAIEAYCRRRFAARTETRAYRELDNRFFGGVLFLDDDLLAVTTLTNGNGEVIPGSGYWLEPRNDAPYGLIRLKSSYAWTFNTDGEVTVAGSWGAVNRAATDDRSVEWTQVSKQACLRLAAFLYRQRENSSDLDRPVLTGDGATILPATLPNDVQMLLAPYRRSSYR